MPPRGRKRKAVEENGPPPKQAFTSLPIKSEFPSGTGSHSAPTAIKQEPAEEQNISIGPLTPTEIREKLLPLLREHENGFGNNVLYSAFPSENKQTLLTVLNGLRQEGIILFKMTPDRKIIYQLNNTPKIVKEAGSTEDALILENIANSGNKGISSIDLKKKTNIPVSTLSKKLKELEKRNLIKAVTLGSSKRKVYLLSSVTPDASLTGDALFGERDLESGAVAEMAKTCLTYLKNKYEEAKRTNTGLVGLRTAALSSSKELYEHLVQRNLTSKDLEISHVERLLFTLTLDGTVEKVARAGSFHPSYRFIPAQDVFGAPLSRLPCGLCKHIDICGEPNSIVSPSSCTYMKDWLKF